MAQPQGVQPVDPTAFDNAPHESPQSPAMAGPSQPMDASAFESAPDENRIPNQQVAPGEDGAPSQTQTPLPSGPTPMFRQHPSSLQYRDIRSKETPEQIRARQEESTGVWGDIWSRMKEPVHESEVERTPGIGPAEAEQLKSQGLAMGQPLLEKIFGKERGDAIREHIALGFSPEVTARAALKSLTDWYSPVMLALSVPGRLAHGYAASAQAAEAAGLAGRATELANKARISGIIGSVSGVPFVARQVHDVVDNWDRMNAAERTAALSGILGGSVMMGAGAASAVSPGAPSAEERAAAPGKAREAVAKMTQATEPEDVETYKRGLESVDLSKAKTFQNVVDTLDQKVRENTGKVDSALQTVTKTIPRTDMETTTPIAGTEGEAVTSNPVEAALDQMRNFYEKTNSPKEAARIEGLQNKLEQTGLTPKEVNDIAREHGRNLSGFNPATGELASGLNRKAAENTRAAVKEIVRKAMPDDVTRDIDKQTSDVIQTRDQFDDFRKAARKLELSLEGQGLLKQVLRKFGAGALAGGMAGGLKGAAEGALGEAAIQSMFPSGRIDPLQLQKKLPKLLKQFQELNATNPQQAAAKLPQVLGALPATGGEEETVPKVPAGEEPAQAAGTPAKIKFTEPHIEGLPRGIDTIAANNHELGHVVALDKNGFDVADVVGEGHPDVSGNIRALTRFDWGRDLDPNPDGTLPYHNLMRHMNRIMEAVVGGAAANEAYDNIPWKENPILEGDLDKAHKLLEIAGIPKDMHDEVIQTHIDRMKEHLSNPEVENLVNEFANTREPNIPDTHLYSASRVQEFINRLGGETSDIHETGPYEQGIEHGAYHEPGAEERTAGSAAGAGVSGPRAEETRETEEEAFQRELRESEQLPYKPPPAGTGPGGIPVGGLTAEPNLPPERSISPEADKIIKAAGAIPGGLQKWDEEGVPDYANFHDPTSGSTLSVALPKLTEEAVRKELEKSRAQYREAEERKAAVAKGPLDAAAGADAFNKERGRPPIEATSKGHDPEFAADVADAYDALEHNPEDPAVQTAYGAAKRDIKDQWNYATKETGVKFEPWKAEGQPYANSTEMMDDVRDNHHLYFFQGGEMPKDHPLADKDPDTGYTYNDMLRAVHDLFGHAAHRFNFGPRGEENAYLVHRQMFSPEAVPALTSETRAQNSWFNFGPHLRNAEGKVPGPKEPGYIPPPERPFAENKAALLPPEFQGSLPVRMSWPETIDLKEEPAGAIDAKTGSRDSKRYGLEVYPEVRKQLDHPPTAADFRAYAEEHKYFLDAHPNLRVGWDTLGDKPELNIGVSTDDLQAAKQLGRALDQRALWDTVEQKEIPLLGKNEQREFPDYPLAQRLRDIGEGESFRFLPEKSFSEKIGDFLTSVPERVGRVIDGAVSALLQGKPDEKDDTWYDKNIGPAADKILDLVNMPKEEVEQRIRLKLQQAGRGIRRLSGLGAESKTVVRPKGSTVGLMDNPLPVKGTGAGGGVTTVDVAKALSEFTKTKIPALELGKAEPEAMVKRAKSLAEDEAKYQLAQNNTGESWYTKDMVDHDRILQEIRPELNDPAKLSLFKMNEAVHSSGQKPYTNLKSALKAWDIYHDTGKFPEVNPETGRSWGPRGIKAYGNAVNMINRLVDQYGEQGASNWLLSNHPVRELRQYNEMGVAGKADDLQPGVMILGPKRGPFAQNLHGKASAFTADMWVARTWNRWMGTIGVDPESGEVTTDSPRSGKERDLMRQSFQGTAKNMDLSTSALQAVLWYYEQALYDRHGAAKESWNFADAARRVAEEDRQKTLFNPEEFEGEK